MKTDNAHLDWKVGMRLEALPESGPVKVLDLFSGNGTLWTNVIRLAPDRDIRVLRVDQKPDRRGIYLRGENVKFLEAMDLSVFNVIDLDAYGVPYPQLREIFARGYRGIVHVTAILIGMAKPHTAFLEELGYSRRMIEKCPSVIGSRSKIFDLLCRYLAKNGVREIAHIPTNTRVGGQHKHYLTFRIGDE